MADTYEAFYNGKPLNPNRGLPTMTYAQAEDCGLTESERLWCCTDGEDTPITADDIPYSTGVSVKDKIELIEIKEKTVSITTVDNQYVAPFTKAAVVQYDNELTKDTFISAYSNLTSSQIIMAYPSYIVFACNVAGTYDLTIKYSKGVQTT